MPISKQETYIFAKIIHKIYICDYKLDYNDCIFCRKNTFLSKTSCKSNIWSHPNRLIVVFTFVICVRNFLNQIIFDCFGSHPTHWRTYTKCKLLKSLFLKYLKTWIHGVYLRFGHWKVLKSSEKLIKMFYFVKK